MAVVVIIVIQHSSISNIHHPDNLQRVGDHWIHLFNANLPNLTTIVIIEGVEIGVERMIMLVCQVTHPTLIVSRLEDDVLLGIVSAVAIHLNNNEPIAQDGIVWAILNHHQFEYQPRPLQVVIITQQEVE